MRPLGVICPCLLAMTMVFPVSAGEVIGYSMYSEFGDIMKGNDLAKLIRPKTVAASNDLSTYRVKVGKSSASENASACRPQNTNQAKVWKFRPLEDKKNKKIIKIEDKPVVPLYRYGRRPTYGGFGAYGPMPPVMAPGMLYPGLPY